MGGLTIFLLREVIFYAKIEGIPGKMLNAWGELIAGLRLKMGMNYCLLSGVNSKSI
jgi:hypothetical protein